MDLRSVSADRSLLVFPVHRLEPQSMFSSGLLEGWERKREEIPNWYRISFSGDKNVLKL